jgi:hypothetical protein
MTSSQPCCERRHFSLLVRNCATLEIKEELALQLAARDSVRTTSRDWQPCELPVRCPWPAPVPRALWHRSQRTLHRASGRPGILSRTDVRAHASKRMSVAVGIAGAGVNAACRSLEGRAANPMGLASRRPSSRICSFSSNRKVLVRARSNADSPSSVSSDFLSALLTLRSTTHRLAFTPGLPSSSFFSSPRLRR